MMLAELRKTPKYVEIVQTIREDLEHQRRSLGAITDAAAESGE